MKNIIVAVMALAIALPLLAQPDSDPVVATINGEVMRKSDLEKLWLNISPEMRKQYELTGGKLAFLDNYITKRLILQEAVKDGFHQREDVKFILDQARDSALFDAYIREEVSQRLVPESEIRRHYESNLSRYRVPRRAKARHILATPSGADVANRTGSNATTPEAAKLKIEGLAKELKQNPEAFIDLAMKFSEDGAAEAGGDLGWFTEGRMVPEFDEVVFSIEPGEVSDPFETEFGWHVVLVEERADEGVRSYEEVREEIREELLRSRTAEVIREIETLSSELRSASYISINRENL